MSPGTSEKVVDEQFISHKRNLIAEGSFNSGKVFLEEESLKPGSLSRHW